MGKGKKSKEKSIFKILLTLMIAAIIVVFVLASQKERYRVLDNASTEVKSVLSDIKELRQTKGYKVIKQDSGYKMIMISEGVTYGKDDTLEISSVNFENNKVNIIVKSNIEKSPEVEVINYPFVIVQVKSNSEIYVCNENGDVYEEILLGDEKDNIVNIEEEVEKSEESEKEESEKEEVEEVEKEEEKEDLIEEVETLDCTFIGKVDKNSIEVKLPNGEYTVIEIDSTGTDFDNIEEGKEIKINYISAGSSKLAISVSE